jgi:hypothetical protein
LDFSPAIEYQQWRDEAKLAGGTRNPRTFGRFSASGYKQKEEAQNEERKQGPLVCSARRRIGKIAEVPHSCTTWPLPNNVEPAADCWSLLLAMLFFLI